jgi:hypothetical protein
MARWSRRRTLACAAGGLAGLAGCLDGGPDDTAETRGTAGTPTTAGGDTATSSEDEPGDGGGDDRGDGDGDGKGDDDGDLDLREANVTGVAVSPDGDGYRFDVTLYHDDEGEDGYANWWQVETLDGERLGRRDLAHPHGTREFTRSTTVAVPDGAACVVVRGHDQTHGYGGRAMLVTVDGGATRAVDQGPEPDAFASEDCPES